MTAYAIRQADYSPPATLADVERFCAQARRQGASDDDEIRVLRIVGWAPIRGLRVKVDLAHNREQAYRKDQNA